MKTPLEQINDKLESARAERRSLQKDRDDKDKQIARADGVIFGLEGAQDVLRAEVKP